MSTAETELSTRNRLLYDRLWTTARLIAPERFSTWPLVRSLLPHAAACLEIAPGLRPRLPIGGTCFLDISLPALEALRQAGGMGVCATATALPFPAGYFGLVSALDIVEHLADDGAAFSELARVTRPDGVLLLSVPLHRAAWSGFDAMVGHARRYEPAQLFAILAEHGFAVERSAAFGMRPRSSRLARLGMWFLDRWPAHAMQLYNRLLFPLALRRQRPLVLRDGVPDLAGLAEIFLLCRRVTPAAAPP